MFNIPSNIKFINYFKFFNVLSALLILFSVASIIYKGLNFGIDFKGGTLIELRVESNEIRINDIRSSFLKMNLGDVSVKKFGEENDYLVKFENTGQKSKIENIKNELLNDLGNNFNFRRVENVGPKVSKELLRSGLIAICLSLSAMLFYIWIRFEWQFSLGAILQFEINLSIVAALLTIVGYSMNDTVVIFDRVRENLRKYSSKDIKEVSNLSINETLSRTIITSLTTLFALLSIFLFGGEILNGFSFAMILGVIFGTYSSIFIANPILIFLKVNQDSVLKKK